MRIYLTTTLLLAILLGLTGLTGCAMEQRVVKENPWNKLFKESEWSDREGDAGGAAAGRSAKGYAVQLAKFEAGLAFGEASELMRKARTEGGLADIWYTTDAQWTRVYAGKFRNPDSDEAQATLAQVRQAKIDGEGVFEDARFVAIGSGRAETLDPHDLRSLSGQGLYTLQIGYFDRQNGTNFRRAAERRVEQLRANDEEAYYYHGPHRSLVLVNAWTRDEAFLSQPGQMDRYSNAVRAVQDKYPHNIPNGEPFTEDDDPELVKTQHSFLVPIP